MGGAGVGVAATSVGVTGVAEEGGLDGLGDGDGDEEGVAEDGAGVCDGEAVVPAGSLLADGVPGSFGVVSAAGGVESGVGATAHPARATISSTDIPTRPTNRPKPVATDCDYMRLMG